MPRNVQKVYVPLDGVTEIQREYLRAVQCAKELKTRLSTQLNSDDTPYTHVTFEKTKAKIVVYERVIRALSLPIDTIPSALEQFK
jgi:hypothetical protein